MNTLHDVCQTKISGDSRNRISAATETLAEVSEQLAQALLIASAHTPMLQSSGAARLLLWTVSVTPETMRESFRLHFVCPQERGAVHGEALVVGPRIPDMIDMGDLR